MINIPPADRHVQGRGVHRQIIRKPGVAALTAGPGVTNGIAQWLPPSGDSSPLLVLGGRAPAGRWGMGSLQEIDHVPFVAPLTGWAATAPSAEAVSGLIDDALRATVRARQGWRSSTFRWTTPFPSPQTAGRPAR